MNQTNRELNAEFDAIYQEWLAALLTLPADGNLVSYDAAPLEAVVFAWIGL